MWLSPLRREILSPEPQCKSLVISLFHYLALSGAFVVYAAKVEYAVDYHAVKFLLIRLVEQFGVALYRIERYDDVAVYLVLLLTSSLFCAII